MWPISRITAAVLGRTGGLRETAHCLAAALGATKSALMRLGRVVGVLVLSTGLLVSKPLLAAPIATWDLPTERADGSELPLTELSEVLVICDDEVVATLPAPATAFDMSEMPFGDYTCWVVVRNVFGQASDGSEPSVVSVGHSRPGEGRDLAVTVKVL